MAAPLFVFVFEQAIWGDATQECFLGLIKLLPRIHCFHQYEDDLGFSPLGDSEVIVLLDEGDTFQRDAIPRQLLQLLGDYRSEKV